MVLIFNKLNVVVFGNIFIFNLIFLLLIMLDLGVYSFVLLIFFLVIVVVVVVCDNFVFIFIYFILGSVLFLCIGFMWL